MRLKRLTSPAVKKKRHQELIPMPRVSQEREKISPVQASTSLSCLLPACPDDGIAFGPGNAGPFPCALPRAELFVPG